MLFTWFTLAGFILLLSPQNFTNKLQFAFARIFRWPLSIGRNIPLAVRTNLTYKSTDSRKEVQYQNYIANLEAQLRQKDRKLEELSGLRTRLHALEGAKLVPADIITASVDSPHCELIINRGQDDHIQEGQFVLGDNGVIGTVSELGARTAKVRLITDSSSVLQVSISDLGVNALLRGAGNNRAKIPLVPVSHKIRSGDVVMATKSPGLLDSPIIVGVITECIRDHSNPALWDITVGPACDIETLSTVAVIVMNVEAD